MTARVPSTRPDGAAGNQAPAVDALLQLREARSESARTRLQGKQAEIRKLEMSIGSIEERRARLARGGEDEILQARLLLDGLTRELLARKRELHRLRKEAGELLKEYMDCRGQRDSVRALRDRQVQAEEYVRERRTEEAACDAAAARTVLRSPTERGEPCAE